MTLFEQLGGSDGVRHLVDDLARRLDDDPVLGPLFVGVDSPTLQQHRAHYFSAVLGGPENYAGRGLRDAHRSLGLTDDHVDRFLLVLDASLATVGAAPETTAAVRDLIERLRPVIVSPSRLE